MTYLKPDELQARCGAVLSTLPTLGAYPAIHEHLSSWLERRGAVIVPAAAACLRELRLPLEQPGVVETVTAWLALSYVSGPLDNFVDGDKHLPAWEALGRDAGTFVALALVADALALAPTTDLHTALRRVALGQALDAGGVTTLAEYRRMVMLKSGSLFQVLFEMPGHLAGANKCVVGALGAFGMQVGLATQIANDAGGIWGSEEIHIIPDGLKPRPTLPILYVLEDEHHPDLKARFASLWSVPPAQRDAAAMQAILEQPHVRTFMKAMLLNCQRQAREAVRPLSEKGQQELLRWFDETYLE